MEKYLKFLEYFTDTKHEYIITYMINMNLFSVIYILKDLSVYIHGTHYPAAYYLFYLIVGKL